MLILDYASINHSEGTWAKDRRHNIELIVIPPNTTQWIQPNDVTVFGPAKAMLRKADEAFLSDDVSERPSLRRVMTVMSECIDKLQPHIAKTFRYVCDSPPDQLRRNKIPACTKSCLFYTVCYHQICGYRTNP